MSSRSRRGMSLRAHQSSQRDRSRHERRFRALQANAGPDRCRSGGRSGRAGDSGSQTRRSRRSARSTTPCSPPGRFATSSTPASSWSTPGIRQTLPLIGDRRPTGRSNRLPAQDPAFALRRSSVPTGGETRNAWVVRILAGGHGGLVTAVALPWERVANIADLAKQPVRVLGDVDEAPPSVEGGGLIIDGVNDHEPGGGGVAGRDGEA